jgi:hypothetical protein
MSSMVIDLENILNEIRSISDCDINEERLPLLFHEMVKQFDLLTSKSHYTLECMSGLLVVLEKSCISGCRIIQLERVITHFLSRQKNIEGKDIHTDSVLSNLFASYLVYLFLNCGNDLDEVLGGMHLDQITIVSLSSFLKRVKPGREISFITCSEVIIAPENCCNFRVVISKYLTSNIDIVLAHGESADISFFHDACVLLKRLVANDTLAALQTTVSLVPCFIYNLNKDFTTNLLILKLLIKCIKVYDNAVELNAVIYFICSNLSLNIHTDFVSWEISSHAIVDTVSSELLSCYISLVYRASLKFQRKDLLERLNSRLGAFTVDSLLQKLVNHDSFLVEFLSVNLCFFTPAIPLPIKADEPVSSGGEAALLQLRQRRSKFSITYGGEGGRDRWITLESNVPSRLIPAGTGFPGLPQSPMYDDSESPSPFSPSDMVVCPAPNTPVDTPEVDIDAVALANDSSNVISNHQISNEGGSGLVVPNHGSGIASHVSPIGDTNQPPSQADTARMNHAGDILDSATAGDDESTDSEDSFGNPAAMSHSFVIHSVKNFFETFWKESYDCLLPINPDVLHFEFLKTIHHSTEVVIDYLISSETEFLQYLLEFLKWHSIFCSFKNKSCQIAANLKDIQTRILKLHNKQLFPYNPEPLLRRIDQVLEQCETVC